MDDSSPLLSGLLSGSDHLHDFSGFLPYIKITNEFWLPTYFAVISLSFCICLIWLVRRARLQKMNRNTALDLALVLMVSGFIGARFLHVVLEAPAYYWAKPARVLEVWQGGFVWYGGAVAGALASLLFLRIRKLEPWPWLDLFAPIAALGYALGRVACLLTGCCFGTVCTLPSGYSFRYPTQAFAVIWELGVLACLLWLELRRRSSRLSWWTKQGQIFFIWLSLHAMGRIVMEAFRADDRGPGLAGLSPSTLVSLVILFISLAAIRRRSKLQ